MKNNNHLPFNSLKNSNAHRRGDIAGIFSVKGQKRKGEPMKNRIITTLFVITLAAFMTGVLSGCAESEEMKTAKADFNTQVDRVMAQQEELSGAIEEAKALASTEEKLLDPEKIENLENAIADGEAAKIDKPAMPIKQEDIIAKTEELKSLDCSKVIDAITSAKKAVEDSIAQYKLVDRPSTEYVTACVQRIGYIDNIATLTEETDNTNNLGKAGWYTGKVVFHSTNVDHTGYDNGYSTLVEIGNPAGGAVEIFANEDDANRRNDELKGMEGTIRSPGAHEVIGTCVVRASQDQATTAMNQEMIDLRSELTRLDL